MLYFLQKHPALQLILALTLCVFAALHLFSTPLAYTDFEVCLPFSAPLAESVQLHPELFRGLILIVILLEALLLCAFFQKGKFTEKTNFFPAVWLMFFYAFCGFLQPFTPIFLTNLALIFLVNLDVASRTSKTPVLLAGILIGLASLYDLTAVILLVYVAISLIIGKINWFKDLLASIIGFLVPYIYVIAGFFFRDNLGGFFQSYAQFRFLPYLFQSPHLTPLFWICLIAFVLFLPYIIIQLRLISDNKKVIIRNRYISLNFLLFILLIMTLCSPIPLSSSLSYFAVPLSFGLAASIPENKFSVAREVVTALFAATLVVMNSGNPF